MMDGSPGLEVSCPFHFLIALNGPAKYATPTREGERHSRCPTSWRQIAELFCSSVLFAAWSDSWGRRVVESYAEVYDEDISGDTFERHV
jgi:hypothetical protein